MTVAELLDLYDDWNRKVVVNDSRLFRIAEGKGWEIYHNEDVSKLPVASFGFCDNEFCIRVNVMVDVHEL